jgi:hypothetical protein
VFNGPHAVSRRRMNKSITHDHLVLYRPSCSAFNDSSKIQTKCFPSFHILRDPQCNVSSSTFLER